LWSIFLLHGFLAHLNFKKLLAFVFLSINFSFLNLGWNFVVL
jgi:hypothetical protein